MKCPKCDTEMASTQVIIHGEKIPVYGCDVCKTKYVLKRELDAKAHDVQRKLKAWMEERGVKQL